METKLYIELIMPSFKDINWHIREESLLLIQSILSTERRKFPTDFYHQVIENILELLDDSKPKVKNAARETILDLLKHSGQAIAMLNEIKEFLELELYEYMLQRLENAGSFAESYTRYLSVNENESRVYCSSI